MNVIWTLGGEGAARERVRRVVSERRVGECIVLVLFELPLVFTIR